MKKFLSVFALCGALLFTVIPVHAGPAPAPVGTQVSGLISTDTIWTHDHSPYLLTGDLTLATGTSLTIESGAAIGLDPKVSVGVHFYLSSSSALIMNGSPGAHVSISDIYKIISFRSSISMKYTDVKRSTFESEWTDIDISSSTLTDSPYTALFLNGSDARIRSSRIENNRAGIGLQGNLDDHVSTLHMSDSIIAGNIEHALDSESTRNVIDVANNWWGSSGGPNVTNSSPYFLNEGSNQLYSYGQITYRPWLNTKPDLDIYTCCSSILFIPGLEASWLQKPEALPLGLGTTTNTLWAPNRNDDVRKLFLNPDGKSPDASIYSGAPIGSIWGLYSIYGKFMSFLDGLTKDNTVNGWYGFGYDWRKPIADVVTGSERKASTTDSLVARVKELAAHSQTGKVTLIAHSNGGLVAKYLVKTLADKGEAGLIDSVISVAVPYLGTPQAITALLYGDTEEIAKGYILKAGVAQELGSNMPSAYSLLPSAQYLSMAPGTITSSSSIGYPNQSLVASAGLLHSVLDNFTWPSAIKRWAIVGWNAMTTKMISFVDHEHSAISSNMGDGTVTARSAAYDSGTTTSIDLKSGGADKTTHANILESSSSEYIVRNIIQNRDSNTVSNAKKIEDAIRVIPGVTVGEPDYSKEQFPLKLSTHSPVELHVYDKNGNHVGIIPKPAGVPADVEDGLYTFFDTDIPGSSFDISDESDTGRDTSIMIPDDGSGPYTVIVKGMGVGPFNFDIDRLGPNGIIEQVSYTDLPTTPLMTATATILVSPLGGSATSSLLLSAPTLSVDIDGDGTVDASAQPNIPTDPITFLEMMRKTVTSLSASSASTKGKDVFAATLRKIDQLESLARAGKISRLHDVAGRFSSHYAHSSIKGMTDADRLTIVNLINEFLGHLGQ